MEGVFHNLRNEEELTQLVNSHACCIVDFYGTWCGPCKNLINSLNEIVPTRPKIVNLMNSGQVRIIKVDIDRFDELASKFKVNSVPTVYVYFNRKLHGPLDGNLPQTIVNLIETQF